MSLNKAFSLFWKHRKQPIIWNQRYKKVGTQKGSLVSLSVCGFKIAIKEPFHCWQQTHRFYIGSGQVVNINLVIFEIPKTNKNITNPTAVWAGPIIICMERGWFFLWENKQFLRPQAILISLQPPSTEFKQEAFKNQVYWCLVNLDDDKNSEWLLTLWLSSKAQR